MDSEKFKISKAKLAFVENNTFCEIETPNIKYSNIEDTVILEGFVREAIELLIRVKSPNAAYDMIIKAIGNEGKKVELNLNFNRRREILSSDYNKLIRNLEDFVKDLDLYTEEKFKLNFVKESLSKLSDSINIINCLISPIYENFNNIDIDLFQFEMPKKEEE